MNLHHRQFVFKFSYICSWGFRVRVPYSALKPLPPNEFPTEMFENTRLSGFGKKAITDGGKETPDPNGPKGSFQFF